MISSDQMMGDDDRCRVNITTFGHVIVIGKASSPDHDYLTFSLTMTIRRTWTFDSFDLNFGTADIHTI
jgi:hypothetical protein